MTDTTPQANPESRPARRGFVLARLADAVRRQDWFTVIVEIAIVVLGVVLGFQVTAWGQARADARLGRAYTERLLADLRVEQRTRRDDIDYYGEVEASAQRADSLLSARSTELGSLLVNAYRATEFVYTPRKRDTWNEVVASGHIGLLPNELASGVEYLFAQNLSDQVVLALRVSPYRRRVRSVLPHTVQTAIREHCSDIVGSGGAITGLQTACDLGLDTAVVASAERALRADPTIAEHLRYHFSDLAVVLSSTQASLNITEALIARLEGRNLDATERALLEGLNIDVPEDGKPDLREPAQD